MLNHQELRTCVLSHCNIMSEEYLKVDGHEHLVRDMNSKAIINTSRSAYIAAVTRSKECTKTKR